MDVSYQPEAVMQKQWSVPYYSLISHLSAFDGFTDVPSFVNIATLTNIGANGGDAKWAF